MGEALDRLLDLLDLEQIEVNIFRGRSPDDWRQRVFGGQVAGQALVAAGRTVPADRPVHSLHAYFIRPGDPSVPIVYTVDRVRDGRSFTTRRVSAIQHGKIIFTLSASFHHPEPGIEHADPMPDAPPPEQVERNSDRWARILGQDHPRVFDSPIDVRSVGPERPVEPHGMVQARARGTAVQPGQAVPEQHRVEQRHVRGVGHQAHMQQLVVGQFPVDPQPDQVPRGAQ